MSSIHHLRQFVNERLTAAAEEIFGVFEKTFFEYEEEIDRQRRLLDGIWKPDIKLHRTELPHQHDLNQVRVSNQDQEDPHPPQIKVEQEDPHFTQINVEQEDTHIPRINMEQEDTHLPRINMEQEDTHLPQIKVEQEELCASLVEEQTAVKQQDYLLNSNPSCERNDNLLLCGTSYQANNENEKTVNPGNTIRPEERHKCTSASATNMKSKLKGEQNDEEHNTYSLENTSGINCQPKLHDKPFKCNVCNKNFDLYEQLTLHMRIHTAEKPFSCTVCAKGFFLKRYLTKHMVIHQSDERRFSCDRCWKSYKSFENLQIHGRSHTGERPHICNTCGKTFSRKSYWKIHIRCHMVEKPYPCNICGKSFIANFLLNRHMKIHVGRCPVPAEPVRKDLFL